MKSGVPENYWVYVINGLCLFSGSSSLVQPQLTISAFPFQAPKSSHPLGTVSLPTIEDWQLPRRYWRKDIDEQEIAYINRGGPE